MAPARPALLSSEREGGLPGTGSPKRTRSGTGSGSNFYLISGQTAQPQTGLCELLSSPGEAHQLRASAGCFRNHLLWLKLALEVTRSGHHLATSGCLEMGTPSLLAARCPGHGPRLFPGGRRHEQPSQSQL